MKQILSAPPTHADGITLGESSADKAGLHGVAVVQRAGAAQAAIGAATYAAPAAITYQAPDVGVSNSGDATTDTVINSLRTQLIALAADSAASRAALVALAADVAAHKALINELRAALVEKGIIKGGA